MSNAINSKKWSSETEYLLSSKNITLRSRLHRQQNVVFADDVFSLQNSTVDGIVDNAPFILVTTPTVEKLYGDQIRSKLHSALSKNSQLFVLNCKEHTKSVEQALEICRQALSMNLRRGAQIIGVGGGVCLDVVGFAASIYRRGVRHVKIPTTLIGLIDAGIGIKNGLNFIDKKSVLGTFYPPEYSILDRSFLRTLDDAHISDGLSESIKMAIVSSRRLFNLLADNSDQLFVERLNCNGGEEVIRLSVEGMLQDLAENLYELDSYERRVDFGHTFSPYIEAKSRYSIRHGQAVAIDMAISTLLAQKMNILTEDDAEKILQAISRLNLPLHASVINVSELFESLKGIVAHRNGHLNLVVPERIGACTFIRDLESIELTMLEKILAELEERNAEAGTCRMVY